MFYEEYINEVQGGIQKLVITDWDCREMTAQEAMNLRSSNANFLN